MPTPISSIRYDVLCLLSFWLHSVVGFFSAHYSFTYFWQADQKLRVCDICGAFLSIYDRFVLHRNYWYWLLFKYLETLNEFKGFLVHVACASSRDCNTQWSKALAYR